MRVTCLQRTGSICLDVRICTAVLVLLESLALPSLCTQEQLLAGWEGQPDKAFAASIIQYDLHRGELAPTAVAASWRNLCSEVDLLQELL